MWWCNTLCERVCGDVIHHMEYFCHNVMYCTSFFFLVMFHIFKIFVYLQWFSPFEFFSCWMFCTSSLFSHNVSRIIFFSSWHFTSFKSFYLCDISQQQEVFSVVMYHTSSYFSCNISHLVKVFFLAICLHGCKVFFMQHVASPQISYLPHKRWTLRLRNCLEKLAKVSFSCLPKLSSFATFHDKNVCTCETFHCLSFPFTMACHISKIFPSPWYFFPRKKYSIWDRKKITFIDAQGIFWLRPIKSIW